MAHDLGEFSYARPYSASETPLSFIGALHSFSEHATDHKSVESAITGSRLSSALFFSGRDIVKAVYQKVENNPAREKDHVNYYHDFDDCYDLNQLTPEFATFLERQAQDVQQAITTIIKFAKHNEQRQGTRPTDAEYEQLKPLLITLWDAFELCDPRLSRAESSYISGRDGHKQLNELQQSLAVLTGTAENAPETAAPRNRIDTAIGVKNKIRSLTGLQNKAEELVTALTNTKDMGQKAANTFLYSRIKLPADMRKTDPDVFRAKLYQMLSREDLDTKEKEKQLKQMLKDEIGVETKAFGLYDKAKWSSDHSKDQFYKTLGYIPGIVEGFDALYTGSWAATHLPAAQEVLDTATQQISDLVAAYADDVSYDGGYKVTLTPIREAERLLTLQDAFFAADMSEEDAAYVNRISEGTLPKRGEGTLKASTVVSLDFKLTDTYNKFAAEHPEEGLSAISPAPRTAEILSDETLTVSVIKELSAAQGIRALQIHKQLTAAPKI